MSTFGIKLRSEREKRGLRLVDVAKETGVAVHYLAALEYDDFASLPDDEKAKNHLKAYAEHLELDPQAAVVEFTRALEASRPAPPDVEEEEAETVEVAGLRPFHPLLLIVAGILIVLLVVVVWQWIGGDAPDEETVPNSVPPATAPETTEQEPETKQAIPDSTNTIEPAEPVAVTSVEAEPPSQPEPRGSELTIVDYGVGTDVVNRRLVGRGEQFAEGEQVSFWTRFQGGKVGETIRHVWLHEGRRMSSVPLKIGGWHWRTQSRKTLMPGSEGSWAVEARDAEGRVLARAEFLCTSTRAPG